jgi:hypothetical protein
MTDAKGQPITRPAGWGRLSATAGNFHASGSWWLLPAVSATGADTVRSDFGRPAAEMAAGRVGCALVAARGTYHARHNRPLAGVS